MHLSVFGSPFVVLSSREAIGELEAGRGARFDDVQALMADLRADD